MSTIYKIALLTAISLSYMSINARAQQETNNGSIAGVVLSDDGTPVLSEVMIYKWSIRDGRANPGAACSTKTDSEGHYQCSFLPPGKFVIFASPLIPEATADNVPGQAKNPGNQQSQSSTHPPSEQQPAQSYPLTFYPNVTDRNSAIKMSLHSDEQASANITVHPVPVYDIHGIFPSRPSAPVIELKTQDEYLSFSTPFVPTYQAATGQFIFSGVPQGNYEITADWAADSSAHHGVALVTLSTSSNKEVRIEDSQMVKIRGHLHYPSSSASRFPPSIAMTSTRMSQKPYTAAVNRNGSFVFPSVMDGEYQFSVTGLEGAFVQSMSISGRDVPNRRIVIGGGQNVGTLEFELGTTSAMVSGEVDVDHVIAGKTGVVVQPMDGGTVALAWVDDQRRFTIRSLSPGDYRLFAWANLDDVEYRNPQYLKIFLEKSTSITVKDNSQITDVDLTAIASDQGNR
jgi:hypothetical protein